MHGGDLYQEDDEQNSHMSQVLGNDQAVIADQCLAGGLYPALAVGRERKFGGTGVSSIQGPFGLAVTDDEDAGRAG